MAMGDEAGREAEEDVSRRQAVKRQRPGRCGTSARAFGLVEVEGEQFVQLTDEAGDE
ncbi:hypothetical protein [Streptomyces sp. MJP52]|uniref:hypothetical protein n=1 Tax=Streptomyces sp. MJP52 TaxID=2940555 RepID=UPI0024745208|nr:hypothetical protein [Streptomyces sp. MJP52]MDH6228376.1 hypothetical protein [Streptomyces sp. MJP52]